MAKNILRNFPAKKLVKNGARLDKLPPSALAAVCELSSAQIMENIAKTMHRPCQVEIVKRKRCLEFRVRVMSEKELAEAMHVAGDRELAEQEPESDSGK